MKLLVLNQLIKHPDWNEEKLEKFFLDYSHFLNNYEGIVIESGSWEIIDESEIQKTK